MTIRYYRTGNTQPLLGTEALREASREELAVLIALQECEGEANIDELARALGIRAARVTSALAYWEAEGVISTQAGKIGVVENEYPPRLHVGTVDATQTKEIAATVHNHDLSLLLSECAGLLGKPALNGREAENITGLFTQYRLPEDFIVTLLADLCARGRGTVRLLVNEAARLCERGIETTADLSDYLRERDSRGEWERTVRRVLGIRERALSATERDVFAKWTQNFGYEEPVLSLAYDITVKNTGRAAVSYMDKLLCKWHDAGVRTEQDVLRYNEENAAARAAGKTEEAPDPPKSNHEKRGRREKVRYGTFDPEEAFRAALERSYGSQDDEDNRGKKENDKA